MKTYFIFLLSLPLLFFQVHAQGDFFEESDAFFKKNVKNGLVDYEGAKEGQAFDKLINQVARLDPSDWSPETRKAFLINAYNLLVIKGVTDVYPIASVNDVAGFFDRKRHLVAGKSITLNELEKQYLLKVYKDPRLHFVLVCGALGCPPLIAEAYLPARLDQQLEQQTRIALNNPYFIRINDSSETAALSQIFNWYGADFGGNENAIRTFINRYRETHIPDSYNTTFYTYDWSLNGTMAGIEGPIQANNAARYVVSSTIPKNTTETKIFNNFYTERTRGSSGEFEQRATFYTTIGSFIYGLTHRVNVGFDIRYRMVRYGSQDESPLRTLSDPTRLGVTTLGPKVRIAPVTRWTNFSIQSAFWFPIGDALAGRSGNQRFIDWEGATWWTQVFNDFPIGNKFSLFTELDFMLEDIGRAEAGRINRFSTPAILIASYFPTPKATIYGLGNFTPFWQQDFDYFYQFGLGSKYQFTPNFELELSYTYFANEFLVQNMGQAGTYNLGIRFNI